MNYKPPSPPYVGPAAHTSAGSNQPIHRIVIHATVSPCVKGGARAVARYFSSQSAGGSAHYIVDCAEAVQDVYDDTIAWHAPPNQNSIGVELCDPQTGPASRWHDADHEAMMKIAAGLVAQLCLAYDVPVRKIGVKSLLAGKHGICGHVDVSRAWHESDHTDPRDFPWKHFMALVEAEVEAIKAAPVERKTRKRHRDPQPKRQDAKVTTRPERIDTQLAHTEHVAADIRGRKPRKRKARRLHRAVRGVRNLLHRLFPKARR